MRKPLVIAVLPVLPVLLAVLLAVALTACGGSRSSQDEVERAVRDQIAEAGGDDVFTDAVVDCIAGEVEDSDLSDEALTTLVDDDPATEDATGHATGVLLTAVSACLRRS